MYSKQDKLADSFMYVPVTLLMISFVPCEACGRFTYTGGEKSIFVCYKLIVCLHNVSTTKATRAEVSLSTVHCEGQSLLGGTLKAWLTKPSMLSSLRRMLVAFSETWNHLIGFVYEVNLLAIDGSIELL